ncbi:MAG: single-stranded-DNA-specific exonuclease RecJ [Clostridia bacterium]|nr:single-stranded-DNA-specific exonuclease RecJ [Clostridia bacterium]
MKYGTWNVASYEKDAADCLLAAGFSPITAAVLCARGYKTVESAREFLSANVPLSDPLTLLGMAAARDRVKKALERREQIAVFGDYDVDGITATCLLTEFLRARGGRVTSYIPARLEEGYGLNEIAIRSLHEAGIKLIVTVDCGITASEEAELCRSLGIDLVITDHHECKADLPFAAAVVDPHRKDQPAPTLELAGVGVAFKLAAAISGDQNALLEECADLLCLGTVADVMPLTGENRTMVARGLKALTNPRRVGLAALMAECAVSPASVTAGTIGYTLAPRINAAGRMGMVDIATELFLTHDAARAVELAANLCKLNRKRQEIESGIYQQAVSMLPAEQEPGAIVLASEQWHQGVVGIVASRLAEEYSCPTFLICLDGEKGKASSRSYGGFNLFQSLETLSELLESYGGHELAAGFTIRRDRIDLFREKMLALSDSFARSGECRAALSCDCEIPPQLLTIANIEALDELEPCGAGCPRPLLVMRDLTVTELMDVGGGKHLRLRLSDGKHTWGAIFFSTNARRAGLCQGDRVDIAFTPQINEYRGVRSVQLNLVDIRPEDSVRADQSRDESLLQQLLSGSRLTAQEAEQLLPTRQDFIAVWRYLTASAEDGLLAEDPGCLCRKIERCCAQKLGVGRIRVCLEIFAEQGLLHLQRKPKALHIRLTNDGRKVDLEESEILIRLRKQKEGT